MARLLFAGYAPVHVLCFLPVYRRLAADPRIEVVLSGGFRHRQDGGVTYTLDGIYDGFAVDGTRIIPIDQARQESFDVVVCAHLADSFFPKSVRRKVQIFHGVSFKNLAVREKALRYDVLCLPGRYHGEQYRSNGLVRREGPTCLLTGFPKTDALVNGGLDRDSYLRRLGVDPRRPTILLAPTGEKHNALEAMGEEVLRSLAAAGSWNVLVKPHDHPKNDIDWFSELAHLEDGVVRLIRDRDVIPCLQAADLLLTDASSVAVEYTLLDRPIVFLDVPDLFKKVRKRAPALDLDTYGRKIGVVVKKPQDVVAVVADSLAHPQREADTRRQMARHVFHGPGRATERVAGVILHAADLAAELPDGVEILRP